VLAQSFHERVSNALARRSTQKSLSRERRQFFQIQHREKINRLETPVHCRRQMPAESVRASGKK
jgi:hypothetical protein